MTTAIKFDATCHAACTAQMTKLCNDGRCWTVAVVFGLAKATPHASERNVPRAPAGNSLSELESLYWQNGQWHNRRKATPAMEQKVWRDADRASGASDGGGSDSKAMARWFRARSRKLEKQLA